MRPRRLAPLAPLLALFPLLACGDKDDSSPDTPSSSGTDAGTGGEGTGDEGTGDAGTGGGDEGSEGDDGAADDTGTSGADDTGTTGTDDTGEPDPPRVSATLDDLAGAWLTGLEGGDWAGIAVGTAGDLDGDGSLDAFLGVPGREIAGTVGLFMGPFSGTRTIEEADARVSVGKFADALGRSVAPVGDANGDGYDDLVVGNASDEAMGKVDFEAGYLLMGPFSGDVGEHDGRIVATASTYLYSTGTSSAVAASPDLTGDGEADVLVALEVLGYYGYSHLEEAYAYVLAGPVTGTRRVAGDAAAALELPRADTCLTVSLAPSGDANGDGVADLLVGSPCHEGADTASGAAWLFEGPVSGWLSTDSATREVGGDAFLGRHGTWLDGSCDLDDDGHDDVVVGGYRSGDTSGWSQAWSGSDAEGLLATFTGWPSGSNAMRVSCARDVDGDGTEDLWIGGLDDPSGGDDAGGAWLFLGPLSGTLGPSEAHVEILGAPEDSVWGAAPAGDLDGDGLDDAWIGAPGDIYAVGRAGLVLGGDIWE